MSAVLQERVDLDDAVLGGIQTFANGCNFRLLFDLPNDVTWIEYGCFGVMVNLCQGKERLLWRWFDDNISHPAIKLKVMLKMHPFEEGVYRLPLEVRPETLMELKKREPCERCGAPFIKPYAAIDNRSPRR